MKFQEKLKQFAHEVNHNQLSKTTAKNKAKRLLEEATKRVDDAKDPRISHEAMTSLSMAKELHDRVVAQ